MDEIDALEASTITGETDMEDLVTEDHSSLEDPLANFTKAPTPNVPESQVGQSIDKSRCFKCKEFGHFQDECPTNKSSWEEGLGPKKFEDYTYTYSGSDIQPQMQINSVNPNYASTYDQALGVIKDSLNTANPLASLNL